MVSSDHISFYSFVAFHMSLVNYKDLNLPQIGEDEDNVALACDDGESMKIVS